MMGEVRGKYNVRGQVRGKYNVMGEVRGKYTVRGEARYGACSVDAVFFPLYR